MNLDILNASVKNKATWVDDEILLFLNRVLILAKK
jgi:hypothetical protein